MCTYEYTCALMLNTHSALTTAPHFKMMEVPPSRQPLSHVSNFTVGGTCSSINKPPECASTPATFESM